MLPLIQTTLQIIQDLPAEMNIEMMQIIHKTMQELIQEMIILITHQIILGLNSELNCPNLDTLLVEMQT